MADVYSAYRLHPRNPQKRCALKRLQEKWSLNPQLRAMFHSEAQLTTYLNHENLVRVFEAGEHDGIPFMEMEYVDGVSCARVLRHVSSRGLRFPTHVALEVCGRVLDGLAHAHAATGPRDEPLGIVHRDVSPGNILLSRHGDVKLSDFGIARSTQFDHHTDPGQVKGKFGYMSPEQVMAQETLDARSDLFSLGVVLAEMLMGRRLFPGKGEFEVLTRMYEADVRVIEGPTSGVNAALIPVIKKALSRERQARFSSALEFRQALEDAGAASGSAADRFSVVEWLHDLGLLPSRSGTYALQLGQEVPDTKRRAT